MAHKRKIPWVIGVCLWDLLCIVSWAMVRCGICSSHLVTELFLCKGLQRMRVVLLLEYQNNNLDTISFKSPTLSTMVMLNSS